VKPARPARAPRQRLDLEVRREQLLQAAFDLFVAKTYDEVGIEDVARAAGASKGLLYHYFPTKKDLYRAAVQRGADLLLERTYMPPETPPLDRLEKGLAAYFDYVEEHGAAYAALMGSGVGVDPDVAAIVETTRAVIAERILEALPLAAIDVTVRAAVRGWIGFVEAIALTWLRDRSPPLSTMRDLAAEVLTAAIVKATELPIEALRNARKTSR
jgi:AcrR family transcriptional regulator